MSQPGNATPLLGAAFMDRLDVGQPVITAIEQGVNPAVG
ncbi:hypothetical protein CUJ84_pRLN3000499 (plasmid) [Rhizobium leguminosarum]|uniref:Uncharacterized protein n=1 Tax=Rhizobium leguminosarum TaxID=384 RepID=A0A2K9ZHD9_RHILE|nr:hypothetical protein CUJ84_pRLN3000499 [Rhizobium leguminosarum]